MADISSKPNINKMFVFDTSASSFYFDYHIEDDVYNIDDPRLKMAATFENQKGMYDALNEHLNRFINFPRPIAVMEYSPNTALCLQKMYESFRQEAVGHLLFITFIHSDDECKYLGFKKPEDAIWQKYEYINSFLLFPFINKIEIPVEHCIERDYINRLFTAAHSFPLLPEVSDEEWAAYAAAKRRRKTDKQV
jgi:hypothetical protein